MIKKTLLLTLILLHAGGTLFSSSLFLYQSLRQESQHTNMKTIEVGDLVAVVSSGFAEQLKSITHLACLATTFTTTKTNADNSNNTIPTNGQQSSASFDTFDFQLRGLANSHKSFATATNCVSNNPSVFNIILIVCFLYLLTRKRPKFLFVYARSTIDASYMSKFQVIETPLFFK